MKYIISRIYLDTTAKARLSLRLFKILLDDGAQLSPASTRKVRSASLEAGAVNF